MLYCLSTKSVVALTLWFCWLHTTALFYFCLWIVYLELIQPTTSVGNLRSRDILVRRNKMLEHESGNPSFRQPLSWNNSVLFSPIHIFGFQIGPVYKNNWVRISPSAFQPQDSNIQTVQIWVRHISFGQRPCFPLCNRYYPQGHT